MTINAAVKADQAKRQMDRVAGTFKCIRDDVADGEFDGARSHIEILKRELAVLDEKLLDAVLLR